MSGYGGVGSCSASGGSSSRNYSSSSSENDSRSDGLTAEGATDYNDAFDCFGSDEDDRGYNSSSHSTDSDSGDSFADYNSCWSIGPTISGVGFRSFPGSEVKVESEHEAVVDREVPPATTAGNYEKAIELAGNAAKSAVGYNVGMYGEVGIGSKQFQITSEARFGAITPESTLASPSFMQRGTSDINNYGIDEFSGRHPEGMPRNSEGYRGDFSRNTVISSQATHNYGSRVAATEGISPDQVEFEVPRPDGRVVDVQRPGTIAGTIIDTEIKAAVSVSGSANRGTGQVGKDVSIASPVRQVEYVFTDNPNTGAAGPSSAAVNNLTRANSLSGGNVSQTYVPDIAPGSAEIDSVVAASKVSRGARAIGRVAAPLGIAADGYSISTAYRQDGGKVGVNTAAAVAGSAGGWVGGAAGAWGGVQAGATIGALGGPVGSAVGGVVGGIIGGVLGGFGLSWGAEAATRAALD